MNDVVRETKRILEKDINKRICENYAFHLYENWWTEQEQKYKLKVKITNKDYLLGIVFQNRFCHCSTFTATKVPFQVFQQRRRRNIIGFWQRPS